MSWHYLLEQEEVSWEGHSLDGAPDALLKLIPTAGLFYGQGRLMDSCRCSRFLRTCSL